MLSLCEVTHLELIHRLRSVRLEPPASRPRWTFGRRPRFVVVGREKRPAA